ncbi:hypothetical protein GCM10020258_37560 [Sphingomonas yabuuchiae]
MTKNPTMLSGRRILLTGGTTGIGRAALKALANEGARVLTFGRHQDALDAALSGIDGEVIGIVEDAATRDGIDRVFAAVDDRLGASTCWSPVPHSARSRSMRWPRRIGAM